MNIEKVSNGYIAEDHVSKKVFLSLNDLMTHLLMRYEGRGNTFVGKSYGDVVIKDRPDPTPTTYAE